MSHTSHIDLKSSFQISSIFWQRWSTPWDKSWYGLSETAVLKPTLPNVRRPTSNALQLSWSAAATCPPISCTSQGEAFTGHHQFWEDDLSYNAKCSCSHTRIIKPSGKISVSTSELSKSHVKQIQSLQYLQEHHPWAVKASKRNKWTLTISLALAVWSLTRTCTTRSRTRCMRSLLRNSCISKLTGELPYLPCMDCRDMSSHWYYGILQ